MRLARALALAGACVALSGASALVQSHPDFSGTWIVDKIDLPERPRGGDMRRGPGGGFGRRGGFGGMRGRGGEGQPQGDRRGPMAGPAVGQKVRIKQTADRLIVTRSSDAGEEMSAYALDGSESTNVQGYGSVKSKTKWDGATLVTESSQDREGPMGEVTLKTREVRSLSEDGATMTVRRTVDTPRGEMTTTVTYRKADRNEP